MAHHPDRNRIYSCLGWAELPEVTLSDGTKLCEGDNLLLCSDGLWVPLSSGVICAALTKSDIMRAVPQLLDLAEKNAGPQCDNLSAIAMTWVE